MIITIVGSFSKSFVPLFSLYELISLTLFCAKSLYLFSISSTAQFKAKAAFFASVTTGIKRWGISLYTLSSTTLGSISNNFTSSGEDLYIILIIIVFMHTLLPEPVAPAISKWGILSIEETTGLPVTSFPKDNGISESISLYSSDKRISFKYTLSLILFGTSMPTAAFPGIGASILISEDAKVKAILSDNETILLNFIPGEGDSS